MLPIIGRRATAEGSISSRQPITFSTARTAPGRDVDSLASRCDSPNLHVLFRVERGQIHVVASRTVADHDAILSGNRHVCLVAEQDRWRDAHVPDLRSQSSTPW